MEKKRYENIFILAVSVVSSDEIKFKPCFCSCFFSALESTSVSILATDKNQRLKMKKKSESGSRIRPRPLLTLSPQYSLDEILARTISPIIQLTIFFVMVIWALDPNRPMHLYSVLPPEYKNVYSLVALLPVEAVFVTMICYFATFSDMCQLLFFGKCQAEFEQIYLQLRSKFASFKINI